MGSNKVMQVVLVILLLMKSVMPSLEPQGCICQMKRLKRTYAVSISLLAFPLSGSDDGYSFTSSKNGDVQKIETVTLAELNNYVLNSPPQSGGPNNTSSSNFCSRESSDAQEDPLHLRDPTQEFMCYKQRLRSH
ncbi:hypothetical protein Bca52824_038959 [Brassica carinata]|uniref:Uncharacterized protein n=1 Tax=Brassica carinata TaxID=52824 RepID=A0A8X7UU57_BRACI|nr:hypothetical protein Bca52824_038959 [Brassica carinata]